MSLTPKVPALRRPLCLHSAADLLGVAHDHVLSTLKVPVPGCTWHQGLQSGLPWPRGLVALDEEGAIDLDRIHGAGEPMEHEALGVRVGARLREREERGNHLGLR